MMRPLGPNIAAMKPAIKIAKPRIRFFCFITLLVSRFIGLGKVRTEPVIRVLSNGLVFGCCNYGKSFQVMFGANKQKKP